MVKTLGPRDHALLTLFKANSVTMHPKNFILLIKSLVRKLMMKLMLFVFVMVNPIVLVSSNLEIYITLLEVVVFLQSLILRHSPRVLLVVMLNMLSFSRNAISKVRELKSEAIFPLLY